MYTEELGVYLVASLLSAIVIFWLVAAWIRLKLRNPPSEWLDVVKAAVKTGAPLPAKLRQPTVRRQLIKRSTKPGIYTNLVGELTTDSVKLGKSEDKLPLIYGFLHPHADAGGGGERVLWVAIKSTLVMDSTNIVALYVGAKKGLSPASLIEQAAVRFGVHFTVAEANRIVVIAITQTKFIDPQTYPVLTLLGQALGMMLVGYEAISNLVPDVFIDTTGLAFSYPIVHWLANIPIYAYVHYPYIQSDMLQTTRIYSPKHWYWRGMMLAYKWAGSCADVMSANSSWTKNHLAKIWTHEKIPIVYPPCATQDFEFRPDAPRSPAAVFLAQFRPEKRHDILIKAFSKVVASSPKSKSKHHPHLILIGSVRNEQDQAHVDGLKALAKQSGLTDNDVTFVVNAPWEAVKKILESSSVGVNAMWNEHFGMGVVEVMAAGLIPVAHASAGPMMDIVKDDAGNDASDRPGFLFISKNDPDFRDRADAQSWPNLSSALLQVFALPLNDQVILRRRAYSAAQRFSDAEFSKAWQKQLEVTDSYLEKYHSLRKKAQLFD